MSSNKQLKIWINTGEISGDLHGASLCRALFALRPNIQLIGMGGPQMRALNFKSFFQVEDLSVMGLTEVVGQLPKILKMLKQIEKKLELERPDAIVVIDSPEFHFKVIKAARKLNIPVYYYISPKAWAWRQNRARFIEQNVKRLISILPFEIDFYKQFGMSIDYVGNPLMDQIDLPALDALPKIPGRIGFMPGSRRKEVRGLMQGFALAAEKLLSIKPDLKFYCAVAPGMDEDFLKSFWYAPVPLHFCKPEDRYSFMRQCEILISASGTAVLESALIGTPTIITYRMSALSFKFANMVVKVKYAGLPNLIAGKEIMPELLQDAGNPEYLAAFAGHWLGITGAHNLVDADNKVFKDIVAPKLQSECGDIAKVKENLAQLRKVVGGPGATHRAAEIILNDL
ncbi:lipid-A-disaccharide synthase [Desulfovibrio sp. OttesenSCG-928-F07]|nr:lipid-A-disaccharide synthase [Desulfovibrio sp. OttesenSCG-928-F07]